MKVKKTIALYHVSDVDIILEWPGINRPDEYVQISEPIEVEFEMIEEEK